MLSENGYNRFAGTQDEFPGLVLGSRVSMPNRQTALQLDAGYTLLPTPRMCDDHNALG
jgi:hypothetical protein